MLYILGRELKDAETTRSYNLSFVGLLLVFSPLVHLIDRGIRSVSVGIAQPLVSLITTQPLLKSLKTCGLTKGRPTHELFHNRHP